MDVRILAASVVLVGCGARGEGSDLEASTAADAMELARTVDATVGLDASAATLDASGSVSGVGDCEWDWSVTGPAAAADYAAAIGNTPCGGTITGTNASVDYAVQDGSLAGTVGLASGLWTYDLSGSRTADTTITSTRRGSSRTYQGQWTLDSLTGTTDGTAPGPFDASLSYTGWFGGDWSLDWSRAADGSVDGSLTGPRGETCTVTGATDDVTVACG